MNRCVESFVTYPTEYVKTRKQLGNATASPLRILIDAVKAQGPRVLYTGAAAFCISNSLKSGVRFLTYDSVRNRFQPDPKTGKPTAVATIIAGVSAGLAEAVTVVTPGENLKTKLVDDRAGRREFTSTTHAIRLILAREGPAGFFRGVVPVMMKQGSNAVVRFTSYQAALNQIKPVFEAKGYEHLAPGVGGAAAGVVTVYATMPFDVVKTKMQALDGGAAYRGTWQCFRAVVAHAGIRGLWEGTTPRLVRLSISGAISFTVYSQVVELLQLGRGQEASVEVKAFS
ncbi:mitochondrial carrier [Thozetella sp. PMI_491]|nr:mitochondrial carrier [Thozetella sp. PMI_491]